MASSDTVRCRLPQSRSPDRAATSTSLIPDAAAPRLKVTIKRWQAVGAWKWRTGDDACGICRSPFDGCCADCKLPGDACPVVWGRCTHSFHIHCIEKWLACNAGQPQCPMCRADWKYRE